MKKSFLDSVLNKLNLQKKAVGPLADDSRVYRSLRSYLASNDSMEVTDPYEKSVWVFASINAIAQNISRVPFYIYKEKPQKKDIKMVVSDGPLPELFLNPNPQMISSTLFFATVLFMELYGESFWVFEGRDDITQVPKEIWPINPSRFEPVLEKNRDGTKTFTGFWDYTAGAFKTRFAPHEILHIKYFNPYDDIRGLSPIEASKSGVEQDFFANKYNKQFFKDGVSLSGIISSPEFLTDSQFNRLKDQFEQKHAGAGNAHKVGVIEGGSTFIETKAMSQRDMEFSILKDTIRGEILAAFKTNEVVLGNYSNIQSYEGIKQSHESFWKETLLPKIIYLEDFLWSKFFSKISTGKFWGGFDTSVIEALREDFAKKVEMGKTLNEMGYPINMINSRLDMGFEDVPWGNTWFVKMGTIPVESAIEFAVNPPSSNDPNEQPAEPDDKIPEDEPMEEPEKPSKDLDYTDRDTSIWANFIARQIPIENLFKNKIKKFLYEQRKRVLERVSLNAKEILNKDEEIKLLQKVLSPLYTAAVQTGAELLKEELLFDGIVIQEDINTFVNERIGFASKSIVHTMINTLEKILLEVKSAGIEVKTRKIKDLYNKSDNKVSQISRTESSAIINGVRYLLMQKQGVRYHKWLTKAENGRHGYLHGKVVKIGESFSDDFLLRYPLDKSAPVGEIISCRCFTTPIIKIK